MLNSATILARAQLVRFRMALHLMHVMGAEFLDDAPLPRHMSIRVVPRDEMVAREAMSKLWLGDA